MNKHEKACNKIIFLLEDENKVWVACKICGLKGRRIGKHLLITHEMASETYLERFPGSLTSALDDSEHQKQACNWIDQAKSRGEDLTDYKQRMGVVVSESIMSNPRERERRSQLLGMLNKTQDSRVRSSIAAKKTSARPEILKMRSKALAAWRKRDPEAFYEKCISKMFSYGTSKPERWVRDFVQREFPEYEFKGNQRLMSHENFHLTKSQKRQIDIMSKSRKIIIEVDGFLHFNNVPQWDQLEKIRAKDTEMNLSAPKMGYTLVRISHDQWDSTGALNDIARLELIRLLTTPSPGLYLIGELYTR